MAASKPGGALPPAAAGPTEGVDDLTKLGFLHEPAVLSSLGVRYARGDIYTRTSGILVACNPWRSLPELYTDAKIDEYHAAVRAAGVLFY